MQAKPDTWILEAPEAPATEVSVSERATEWASEGLPAYVRRCKWVSDWLSGGVVVWAVNQDNLALVDGLIDLWLIGRSFFCLDICLFINFTYLLIHYSIVIGELCVGCMTELSKSFLLAVERDTKTPWRIQAHETAPKANFCMIWCSASVLQHWVQERVLKTRKVLDKTRRSHSSVIWSPDRCRQIHSQDYEDPWSSHSDVLCNPGSWHVVQKCPTRLSMSYEFISEWFHWPISSWSSEQLIDIAL